LQSGILPRDQPGGPRRLSPWPRCDPPPVYVRSACVPSKPGRSREREALRTSPLSAGDSPPPMCLRNACGGRSEQE
jgi:hypothetical protein